MNNIKHQISNYLKQSANEVYDVAKDLCKNGIVSKDCTWYHSAWQYFRMMNLVSTPTWHDKFFRKGLSRSLIGGKKEINILISGTADYSLLAYVINACGSVECKVNIDVVDSCQTPLFACQWYADKKSTQVNLINKNILELENYNHYDLICCGAFLTRFNKSDACKVIDKWKDLLVTGGKIVTTVRVYKKKSVSDKKQERYKQKFVNKAKVKYKSYKKYIKLSQEQIVDLAKKYTNNMSSNKLGDEKEILSLFKDFDVFSKLKPTKGEYSKTTYLEISATKRAK